MVPATGSDDLLVSGNQPSAHIANLINNAFFEPMQSYHPIESLPPFNDDQDPIDITEVAVCLPLQKLNPHKASGSDGLPNWLLKEYAVVLADPIRSVLDSTFNEQKLPSSWKLANVIPLPKQKPVTDLNRHLRPISLTPSFSQVAEDFVVTLFVGSAVPELIDPDQFGAVSKSSTVQALISMIHQLVQATDGSGAAVRLVLFDYRKAFDLIDHTLLVQKIYRLAIPRGIARWVSDFLMNRQQRVKLSRDCFSE